MENKRKPWVNWVLFSATVVVVFLLGLLASSVTERKAEKATVFKPTVQISEFEPRNEVWGKNYPKQYQSYIQTKDTSFKSKYNGNAMIDMLAVDPRLVVLWAGYPFSKDYNQGRGHFYAITDSYNTLRNGGPKNAEEGTTPSTCWTCKSPDVPRLMKEIGIPAFYKGKWASKGSEIVNHIGCADCHDPATMNLRITRPALKEAFARQGKKIEDATHQEMRSLVCAQCHVEYYFNKKYPGAEEIPYLTFPWDKSMTAEGMEEYYDAIQFSDWTHALSKAPMLKAQHPDYEVYTTGIHAERGVSCADCHMPYKTEGSQKFTDHHMQSPLNNIANSCQVCHREEASTLLKNVYDRQDKIIENRDQLEILLVQAHVEAKKAWDSGATEEQMKDILQDIRHGQWRWDYVAAGHGNSFHSPVETSRVISKGITVTQEARIKLAVLLKKLGFEGKVEYPDITTKEKAQIFIGLKPDEMKAEKEAFKKGLLLQWTEDAKKRESKMEIKYY